MSKYYDDEYEGVSAESFLREEEEREQGKIEVDPEEARLRERDNKLDEGLAQPREINKFNIFKEHIYQYFDISKEELDKLKPREEIEVEVDLAESRRKRMGFTYLPTSLEEKHRKTVPKWAREVQCPKCGAIMDVLKSKRSTKFGESVLFQCHAVDLYYEACLTIMQLTTDTFYWMRASDFTSTDWDWQQVAEETVPVLPNGKPIAHDPTGKFIKPVEIPPCPWQKRVTKKVLWEKFWEEIMEHGEISSSELTALVQEEREQDKRGKFARNLHDLVDTLPTWMQQRTGYVIKDFANIFTVVGQSRGALDMYPFSDEDYRTKHGF